MTNKIINTTDNDFSVTYKLNKKTGIFNWYPYTEGFSKPFVEKMLDIFNVKNNEVVLDPFGGCGTTSLTCTLNGIDSVSVDVNPFMCFVSETKVESLNLDTKKIKNEFKNLIRHIKYNEKGDMYKKHFYYKRPFFNEENFKQAINIKESIKYLSCDKLLKNFFNLCIASLIVKISNMKRGPDLRYKNKKMEKINVYNMFEENVNKCITDIEDLNISNKGKMELINTDISNGSKKFDKIINTIDFFITSPPYLNGTNYIRNTKLELGFMDFINSEKDLKTLRKELITAGINSVSKSKIYDFKLKFLSDVLIKVRKNAYDSRIPKMVNDYFYDMTLAMKNIYKFLKKNGRGVIVIGDSQFGGVHIETDIFLAKICKTIGFNVEKIEAVRKRRSKNGMKLRESLIFVRK